MIEKPKHDISFRVMRTLTDGYRTLQLENGVGGDHIGIEVETKDGDLVTIGLEVLPNGLHNIYAISSKYVILSPPNGLHRTTGKLVKIKTDHSFDHVKQPRTHFTTLHDLCVEYGIDKPQYFTLRKELAAFRHLENKEQNDLLRSISSYPKLVEYLLQLQEMDKPLGKNKK